MLNLQNHQFHVVQLSHSNWFIACPIALPVKTERRALNSVILIITKLWSSSTESYYGQSLPQTFNAPWQGKYDHHPSLYRRGHLRLGKMCCVSLGLDPGLQTWRPLPHLVAASHSWWAVPTQCSPRGCGEGDPSD